jgi:hypothetical protein
MNDVIVNVSYCQSHRKRPRDERLDGLLHALWLEECVGYLRAFGLSAVVSVTCWPGLCAVKSDERAVLWRVLDLAQMMTMPELGHQEGAAWNICQGLEFAHKWNFRYMIHTAEDVVVSHETLRQVIDLLHQGCVYVGSDWDGVVHERPVHGLNSQFFGCDVSRLYGSFDPKWLSSTKEEMLRDGGTLEEVLRKAVGDGRTYLFPVEGERHGPYEHTHDCHQWRLLMRRIGAMLPREMEMIDVPFAAPTACDELRQRFLDACAHASDIHQHLTVMRDVARNCRHVTELGIGGGNSTLAWLLVQPEELLLVDVCEQPVLPDIRRLCGRTKVIFLQSDSAKADLPPTDLLFIDTQHTYAHLREELRLHGNKARRNIVLHDTTIFGDVGDDGRSPGLWAAVEEFLTANPHWRVLLRYHHNNGLTILQRGVA